MAEQIIGSVGVRQAEIANEETKDNDGNRAFMMTASHEGGIHEARKYDDALTYKATY